MQAIVVGSNPSLAIIFIFLLLLCVAKPVAVKLRCHASALIFSFMDSFVFKQQVPFRVDFLSVTLDYRVQCPGLGLGVKI